MAVFAPIARPRVATTRTANPGLVRNWRRANRKSFPRGIEDGSADGRPKRTRAFSVVYAEVNGLDLFASGKARAGPDYVCPRTSKTTPRDIAYGICRIG